MTKIELLQVSARNWFGNSQQHSIHAQLLKARGLNKLADMIMAESDEEWEEAKKVNARLIELGITPVVEIREYPVITEVGSDVEDFGVGERVCAHIDLAGQGCFAEYATAPTYCVAHIPEKVSFEEAAGMMSTGITAYQVIHRKVNLANRKTALIHAGSGGVGSMAVQLAKEAGLTVYTTVPGNAKDFVRELGADVAIDFETENFVEEINRLTDGKGVDFILDPLGQGHVDQNIDLLAFNGDIVCLTTPPSADAVNKLFLRGSGLHLIFVGAVHQSGNFQQMKDLSIMAKSMLSLMDEGKVKVPIARTFGFSELATALATLEKNPPLGKFVVTVNE